MARGKVGSRTPKTLSQDIYLHLRPHVEQVGWNAPQIDGLTVAKMAKSLDVEVEPGDVVVCVNVAVASSFFDDTRPAAYLFIEPADAHPVQVLPTGPEAVTE